MIDKNLGIVAIATLVAGAGFLLKGEKTSNKSAENREFMAQSGRAIDKRKIQFGLGQDGYGGSGVGVRSRHSVEFTQPIREEMIKKLSRRGLIPDFVASPGYPSYREWLENNFEKQTRQFEIPQLTQYKNGYLFDTVVRRQELPPQYDMSGKELPYNKQSRYIGNKENKSQTKGYWKYPTLNWKLITKQRAQYPIDMAAGVYGKMYQTSIQQRPLEPDMRGTPFGNLNWGKSIALKHWMELNPQVKFITYKSGKYGNRHTIRYLKDLPPSLSQSQVRILSNELGGAIEYRRTMYLRLPDKSVVDKQAKEAFDYFVILWKEWYNSIMIERYSQEIMADFQKGVQENAMWANFKSSGKLREYLMEQFDNNRRVNPPVGYVNFTKATWEEWKEAQLKGVMDKHNERMAILDGQMSWS